MQIETNGWSTRPIQWIVNERFGKSRSRSNSGLLFTNHSDRFSSVFTRFHSTASCTIQVNVPSTSFESLSSLFHHQYRLHQIVPISHTATGISPVFTSKDTLFFHLTLRFCAAASQAIIASRLFPGLIKAWPALLVSK